MPSCALRFHSLAKRSRCRAAISSPSTSLPVRGRVRRRERRSIRWTAASAARSQQHRFFGRTLGACFRGIRAAAFGPSTAGRGPHCVGPSQRGRDGTPWRRRASHAGTTRRATAQPGGAAASAEGATGSRTVRPRFRATCNDSEPGPAAGLAATARVRSASTRVRARAATSLRERFRRGRARVCAVWGRSRAVPAGE